MGGEEGSVDGTTVGGEVEMTDKMRNGRARSPRGLETLPLDYGFNRGNSVDLRADGGGSEGWAQHD